MPSRLQPGWWPLQSPWEPRRAGRGRLSPCCPRSHLAGSQISRCRSAGFRSRTALREGFLHPALLEACSCYGGQLHTLYRSLLGVPSSPGNPWRGSCCVGPARCCSFRKRKREAIEGVRLAFPPLQWGLGVVQSRACLDFPSHLLIEPARAQRQWQRMDLRILERR